MKDLKFILLAFVHWVFLAATAQAHYDPTIGQFISRDPTGEVEDINLYRITGGDPINNVDAGGLAKVAIDGKGNMTQLGQTILDVAKGDPNAARSLLMAAQVQAETTGIKVPGDGGQDSMRNVMEAIETAVGQAQSDGSREWKIIAAGAGLSGERGFGGYKDAWMTAKLAEYAPLIAANAQTAIQLRAFERATNEKSTIEQNSPSFKLKEIGLATADIPMHLGAAVLSAAMATDVTTGNAITWNGWGNGGFGLQEISPGERTFAAAMVFLPIGRVEGVADDFVRVGARGRSFARTALKPWGATAKRYEITPFSGQLTRTAWPENRGFLGVPSAVTLQPGTIIDRYGSRFGTFVAKGGTPFPMRGLPEDVLRYEPEAYRVLQGIEVKSGLTAPAFGKLGLGTQYELPFTVDELIRLGVLEPIAR